MDMYIRYKGEFLSRDNVAWRVEILQQADGPWPVSADLEFPAEEPLVIEWDHKDKEEVIQGSTATLKTISPGDRTYIDLYTIAPAQIRLDVYRDGALYWSGGLDPEFYEEPYESARDYDVTLIFSDFGVLDRIKYDMEGMLTLREIAECCLTRAGINTTLDDSLISTSLTQDGGAMSLDDLAVMSANFIDEDGEASTLEDVLEGVLQPLGLRIVQRCGRVWVYDLHGLYTKGDRQRVVWDGDSQTLGVDKVYNNAVITWSPYPQTSDLLPDTCWTEETDITEVAPNMRDGRVVGDCRIWSYAEGEEAEDMLSAANVGFTLWTSEKGENAEIDAANGVRFFKTVPQYGGEESEGIAMTWPWVEVESDGGKFKGFAANQHGVDIKKLWHYNEKIGAYMFKTKSVQLPPVNDPAKLRLCVTMEMLVDPRFNYNDPAKNWSKTTFPIKDFEAKWNKYGNFVYIPVAIRFRPNGSEDIYTWAGGGAMYNDPTRRTRPMYGTWLRPQDLSGNPVYDYLSYYDVDDHVSKSGAIGWKTNRMGVNTYKGNLTWLLKNCPDGQFTTYPNVGGRGGELWIEVLYGMRVYKAGADPQASTTEYLKYEHLPYFYFWTMCKMPQINVVDARILGEDTDIDDVEYRAEINAQAKENIEIDTICGTKAGGAPLARGAYHYAYTGKQVTELTRAGRTTQAENLLCGTLFSQYGQRHTVLSGEAKIAAQPMCVFTEDNQGDRLFIVSQDVQNAIAGTSELEITELRPDEYKERSGDE